MTKGRRDFYNTLRSELENKLSKIKFTEITKELRSYIYNLIVDTMISFGFIINDYNLEVEKGVSFSGLRFFNVLRIYMTMINQEFIFSHYVPPVGVWVTTQLK